MLRSTAIAALLLASPLAAQDAEVGSAGPRDTRDGTYMQSIDDIDVRNADGEVIGEIEEILIDQDGKPAGFVIEFGGFLGLADSDVAVPLEALTWNESHYVSKMTQEQLEALRPWDE
ncbi:PRC-barrel domain-containing protein [Marivita sp. S2033]|uniref:PRC-barrel domain-containing protein n=1 Tax=Marivita sp. S2033 TaxID=3373187 RepID=UPI003982C1AC